MPGEGEEMPVLEKDILAMKTLAELRQLRAADIGQRFLEGNEITHILTLCGAFWKHSGDPKAPHAELVSHGGKPGKHSDGFVDTLRALSYTNICAIMAHQIADRVENVMLAASMDPIVDWVAGSDHAGATLSFRVAEIFNARHDFTAKGSDNVQLWNRFTIRPEEWVLQVEELSTDLKTPLAVRTGIRQAHPYPIQFIPICGLVVSRSARREFDGTAVYPLVHYDIQTWDPSVETCPLCAGGSKPIKAKTNWDELIGRD